VILPPAIADYLAGLHPQPDPLLAEMREHGRRDGIPIVDHTTGVLLELVAQAAQARRAVEVGTAIGVSTLHLARGGAHVTSFEVDPERHAAASDYLSRAGLVDRVDLRLQDADEALAALRPEPPIDLAFIDGPKDRYGDHLERLAELVRPGGLLLVDNVLISGAAATQEPTAPWGAQHIANIRAVNQRLAAHPLLKTAFLPVGDGVALAVRQRAPE
jgi:predicted O-methyltransferase YrrM